MPKTFLELAKAGLIETARGRLRNKFPNGDYKGSGSGFLDAVHAVQSKGAEKGDIPFEVARSVVRRAITSLKGAKQLSDGGNRLRPNQFGLDPSFEALTSARFVYDALVICQDDETREQTKSRIYVESNTSLTGEELRSEVLDAFTKEQGSLRGAKTTSIPEGKCNLIDIIFLSAIRTR